MVKKKTNYPVREPNADDAIELFGILGAAGLDGTAGQAVGVAIAAFQSEDPRAQDVVLRAAAEAILSGLSAALRDRQTRDDAKNFLYNIWDPKLALKEDETYEEKKLAEWRKLPMQAPLGIIDSFRHTQNFTDFLSFFTAMLPKKSTETPQTETPNGTTGPLAQPRNPAKPSGAS